MNRTIERLLSHRSIRRFKEQTIAPELLRSVIAAGQAASTSSFCQSTSVIRVTDPDKRAQMAVWAGNQPYVATAPEFLVFCADLWRAHHNIHLGAEPEGIDLDSFSWTEQLITSVVDTALFAQNCAVAAESAELGICFIGGIRNEIGAVSDCLGLPQLVVPLFGLCLGYPDQEPSVRPRLPQPLVLFDDAYPDYGDELNQGLKEYDAQIKLYYETRTGGKLSQTWAEQLAKQVETQNRPHMKSFLDKKGFARK